MSALVLNWSFEGDRVQRGGKERIRAEATHTVTGSGSRRRRSQQTGWTTAGEKGEGRVLLRRHDFLSATRRPDFASNARKKEGGGERCRVLSMGNCLISTEGRERGPCLALPRLSVDCIICKDDKETESALKGELKLRNKLLKNRKVKPGQA